MGYLLEVVKMNPREEEGCHPEAAKKGYLLAVAMKNPKEVDFHREAAAMKNPKAEGFHLEAAASLNPKVVEKKNPKEEAEEKRNPTDSAGAE